MSSIETISPASPTKRARSMSVFTCSAFDKVHEDVAIVSAFHFASLYKESLPITKRMLTDYPGCVSRLAQAYIGPDSYFEHELEMVCIYARRLSVFYDEMVHRLDASGTTMQLTKRVDTPERFAFAFMRAQMAAIYVEPKDWWASFVAQFGQLVMHYYIGPVMDEFRDQLELALHAALYIQVFHQKMLMMKNEEESDEE